MRLKSLRLQLSLLQASYSYISVAMALLPVCLLSFAVSLAFILPGGVADDPEEILVRSFELDSENCSSQVHCPRTLNEYANEVDQYFLDNTTFTFMPGIHQLSIPLHLDGLSNVVLRAMDAENVTLQVNFSDSESSNSMPNNNIVWTNCHNITIHGLNFNITGLPYTLNFDDTSGESDISVLEFRQGSSSIFLSDLTLRGSGRWRAIWLQNVDQVTISSLSVSEAMSNNGSAVHATQSSVDFYGHNSFMDNMATIRGGAISLSSTTSNLLENLLFSGNRADYGGAMYVEKCSLNMSGTLNFCDNTAHNGGAMLIVISAPNNFTLSGTVTFVNNSAAAYGGAILYKAISESDHAVISGTVLFINNTASGGGAIFIHNPLDHLLISGDISFFGNAANLVPGLEYGFGFGGAVDVLSGSVTFSGDVIFADNSAHRGGALILRYSTCRLSGFILFENNTATLEGGAVLLHNYSPLRSQKSMESQLYMTNTVKFLANSAKQGGAIAFRENTRLKLNTSLQAHFVNNRAEIYGGAIFVRSDATTDRMSCFAPPDTLNECFFALDSVFSINLNFSYNSAGEAGSDIFGGNLERCEISIDGSSWDPLPFIRELAVFNGDNSTTSDISSEPLRVYICDNDSNLMDSASLSIVRATEANLSVLIVGQDRGSVPSSVRISLNNDVSIDAARRIQDTGKTCTPVSYRLKSENDTTSFNLFPDDGPCRSIGMSTATVNITFLPCPNGFELKGPECDCEERLRVTEHDITCNVDDSTIFRQSNTFWMGTVFDDDNGTGDYIGLILHLGCPIDYCTSSPVNLTVNNVDAQCDHNHVGILCGSCREDHSIAFGGLHCLKCSSAYIALIIPFALAGIVLVAAILLLKFSASANGTINGLIFYANVVQANRSVFIPLGDTNVLTMFIAWLNLDLGIEICFYDGMTTYAFTWLQFLFPFYVWALIVTIIIVCHYSRRISKIFGTNPVAALATLLLLSYSKILRTVIFALTFTRLEYPDRIEYVWRYDGSVPYFQRADFTALGIFAMVVLLFLFVPYTLLLLCGYWLRIWSHWKIFSWINKIMPFLDAYYAPYKKETRYWTGLLLLVRCILFLAFSQTSDGGLSDTKFNLLAVSSVTVCLATLAWLHRGIYERLYNDILEGFFILNLCIFAIASYHVDGYGIQAAIAYTSIGLAFATFLGIVLCHAYMILRNTAMWKKFVSKIKIFHTKNTCDGRNQPSENCDSNARGPTTTFLELRESLLDITVVTATNNQK